MLRHELAPRRIFGWLGFVLIALTANRVAIAAEAVSRVSRRNEEVRVDQDNSKTKAIPPRRARSEFREQWR